MILTDDAASAAADAVLNLLDHGYLRLLDAGGRVLAELRFGALAFDAARDGRARSRPIQPTLARASGRVVAFVGCQEDGERIVLDGTVGTAVADLVLSSVDVELGDVLEVDRITYTHPRSL